MTIEPHDIAIDCSHWQGVIDWPAVAASGIRIAMIKATEGTAFVDPKWDGNRSAAERAGIEVIPYHFLRPGRPEKQASHFRQVAGLQRDMPFCLDWEGKASETSTAIDTETIGGELSAIADRLPLGYWGIPGSTPAWPTAAMLEWPRWVARYPKQGARRWEDVPASRRTDWRHCWLTGDQDRPPLFAQYTQWGRVPGVAGDVDRNVAFFPSADDAVAWCRSEAPAAPTDRRAQLDAAIATARMLQQQLAEIDLGGGLLYRGAIDGWIGDKSARAAEAAYRAWRNDRP